MLRQQLGAGGVVGRQRVEAVEQQRLDSWWQRVRWESGGSVRCVVVALCVLVGGPAAQ